MKLEVCGGLIALNVLAAAAGDFVDKVDLMYGSGNTCGSCLVGPCLPYGSCHPSPDSVWPLPGQRRRKPASGYHPGDPIDGFSQIHAHGAGSGCPSYGLFLVRPCLKGEPYRPECLKIEFAKPYLFRGLLQNGVRVEIAVTAHGAIYRFCFPPGWCGGLEYDVHRKIAQKVASTNAFFVRKDNFVMGGGTYSGNWNPALYDCFFYGEEITKGDNLELRIAVSFKSIDQAKVWFAKELKNTLLEKAVASARRIWESRLGTVEVKGLDAEGERRFYSNLCHVFIQPRDRSGDFGWCNASDRVFDDQYTAWDTWRTLFPLWTILDPKSAVANVNSYANRQRMLGKCEVAFIAGRDYQVGQAGDDVDNIIADAVVKCLDGIDLSGAWDVLAAHAARRTKDYRMIGWATEKREGYDWRFRSGSATLGFAYNDWCAYRVAERLGKTSEAQMLKDRSGNWTNVWDATAMDGASGFTGFVRARDARGNFSNTPLRKDKDFYQGSSWEYSFFVPHDVPGLVARCGGTDAFIRRLEYAFEHELIDFSNEPSFLTPFLACFCGRPDVAAKCAARMKASFTEKGPPGDDDSGAMASLYVFLSAGFFPIAGQDMYALHGTDVPELVFKLGSGKSFVVRGKSGTGFEAVYLNGRRLEKPFIQHKDILAGGELRFE